MANFKPMRGDYAVDQALYTVEACYDPNGYNLYNMSPNVAEWVDSLMRKKPTILQLV